MPLLPLLAQVQKHLNRTAIIDNSGTYHYAQVYHYSRAIAYTLLQGNESLHEARVAFLCPPGINYVATQWAIWQAGGIAVPLCTVHPPNELQYVVQDSAASIVVSHPSYATVLSPIAQAQQCRFLCYDLAMEIPSIPAAAPPLPDVSLQQRAMILYTSGTTGKPKGVVSTHANISAQIQTLVEAWQWDSQDHILHVLPLHHTHGIINKLCCAMWSGACCEMLPKFEAKAVWTRFSEGRITVFMAVPTIYHRLIQHWEKVDKNTQIAWTTACKLMRLMVSGSAALPVSTLHKWKHISGHTLLERYGMTEIGMALSNSYTHKRLPGKVGKPLPHVQARVVNEQNIPVPNGEQGELQIKGPTVFLEYWNKPEASTNAFVDGWFKTGDIVCVTNGVYRIVGRNSVDIIKTGGYKVSALEIEEVLRSHPAIQACAVVGIPDAVWGEKVCAALVLTSNTPKQVPNDLKSWCKKQLAPYKVPSIFAILPALPRNVLGKVTKPKLKAHFIQL